MRVLLIDIGNSRVKWRIVDPRRGWPPADRDEEANTFDESGSEFSSIGLDDLPQLVQRFGGSREPMLDAVYLSNVAGAEAEDAVRDAVRARWGDLEVHPLIPSAEQCGVVNGYRDKAQLGPDRWAALLGAHALLPARHLLVCSFGTATTIDLLLHEGADAMRASFVGGLILPGFEAMRRSLARDTARLPLAQGEVVEFATRTDDAIASGIAAAQVGAVMRALGHARERAAARDARAVGHPFSCVLAGGDAKAIAAHLSNVRMQLQIVPDLVLRGLYAIARDAHRDHHSHDEQHDSARHDHGPPLAREHS